MARPKVELPNREKIIELYTRFQSLRLTAEALGIPKERCRRALHFYGVTCPKQKKVITDRGELESIRFSAEVVPKHYYGKIATWLREHPMRKLPRSMYGIAEIIGVSPETVRSYFYRQRKQLKEKLAEFPDIVELPLELIDVNKNVYQTNEFASYCYVADYYSLFVTIKARLLNGSLVSFQIDNVTDFERVLVDAIQALPASQRASVLLRRFDHQLPPARLQERYRPATIRHGLQTPGL
jgi:hypothetical protein